MADPIPSVVQGLGPIGQRIFLAAQADAQLLEEVSAALTAREAALCSFIERDLSGNPGSLADLLACVEWPPDDATERSVAVWWALWDSNPGPTD